MLRKNQGIENSQSQERNRSRAFAGRGALEALAHSREYTFAIDNITSKLSCTDMRELLRLIPECFGGVVKVEISGEGQNAPLVSAFVKEDKVVFTGSSVQEEHFVKTSIPLILKHSDGHRKIGEMHILSFFPLCLDKNHPNDESDTEKVLDVMGSMIAKTMDDKLDGLTALPVRKYFERTLNEHISGGKMFSLITLDIDHFKKINDSFGHPQGDHVLASLARILQNGVRARADCTDTVFRVGGEEFAILLSDVSMEEATLVAERLRTAIKSHDFGLGRAVTCSFGVADASETSESAALYRLADERMYTAKNSGRDSVVPSERVSLLGIRAND